MRNGYCDYRCMGCTHIPQCSVLAIYHSHHPGRDPKDTCHPIPFECLRGGEEWPCVIRTMDLCYHCYYHGIFKHWQVVNYKRIKGDESLHTQEGDRGHMKPTGLGMFVWLPQHCENGDPSAVAAKAKLCGIDFLVLHNFCSAKYVEALHDGGIECVIYSGYVKPTNYQEFVLNAPDIVDTGVNGIAVDAELEWELANDGKTPQARHVEASDFAHKLRAAVGDLYLADAGAWALPSFHPNYPDAEFGVVFDAAWPERYWTESTRSYQQWMAASEHQWEGKSPLYKSVLPIGSAYGTNTSVPAGHQALKQDDFRDFLLRYPDKSLWSWMHVPGWAWDVMRDVAGISSVAQPAQPDVSDNEPLPWDDEDEALANS